MIVGLFVAVCSLHGDTLFRAVVHVLLLACVL